MSYESKMLEQFKMPTRKQVEQTLLRTLLKYNGVIKEFGAGEQIVDKLAEEFALTARQRSAFLETVYRKENRLKKSSLWHRLLFRAADSLAKENLVSRPTETFHLTKRREWMLTEKGFDHALKLCNIPISEKVNLPTKSFEVEKIVKKLITFPKAEDYNPFDKSKKVVKKTREAVMRNRAFRLAVVEAYKQRCAVCGLKIKSPDSIRWEVEAAHIVPNRSFGRDDICNGIALCHLHHWAFDVGWFTLQDDYKVLISPQIRYLPADCGKIGDYEFFRVLGNQQSKICLPTRSEIHPHHNAIRWHRENIFHQQCEQGKI
jgi:hypothetical protein